MAKKNDLIMYGAIGLGAYLLLGKKSSTGVTLNTGSTVPKPGTVLTNPGQTNVGGYNISIPNGVDPNARIYPAGGTFANTITYGQYAVAQQLNPNNGNPNYTLTDSEAQQYLQNYLDLQQGLPAWVGHVPGINTLNDAARDHWKKYGAAEKRIFTVLTPPSTVAFIPAPPNPNTSTSSGGGKSWISSALGIAGSIISLFGADDPILNDYEAEILITGSAILSDILPMFSHDPLYPGIRAKSTELLEQYTA